MTNIIATDNSKNILVPKILLEKSGLSTDAIVQTKKGEIRIISARKQTVTENTLISEKALAADWNRPEEEQAWIHLK